MTELTPNPSRELRKSAMDYLARREHSRHELRQKLQKRQPDADILEQVLEKLEDDNLLSDERFTEAFVRAKVNNGNGPVKIRYELKQKGVDAPIDAVVQALGVNWFDLAHQVRVKRFGEALPSDMNEKAKQLRFLAQRGFSAEHSYALFD